MQLPMRGGIRAGVEPEVESGEGAGRWMVKWTCLLRVHAPPLFTLHVKPTSGLQGPGPCLHEGREQTAGPAWTGSPPNLLPRVTHPVPPAALPNATHGLELASLSATFEIENVNVTIKKSFAYLSFSTF